MERRPRLDLGWLSGLLPDPEFLSCLISGVKAPSLPDKPFPSLIVAQILLHLSRFS